MNEQERIKLTQVCKLLGELLPNATPPVDAKPEPHCPVAAFCAEFLWRDDSACISTEEIADAYENAVSDGLAVPLARGQIFRRLPAAMFRVFGARQTHSLACSWKTARGYRGVGVRPNELPPDEPEAMPTPETAEGLAAADVSSPGADLADVDPVTDDQGQSEPPPGA